MEMFFMDEILILDFFSGRESKEDDYLLLYPFRWNEMNKTWAMTHLLRPLVITVNYTKMGQVHFRTTGFAG